MLCNNSLANHPFTSEDIKRSCQDLRVLGKREFKELLKWRQHIRVSLGLDKKKEPKPSEDKGEEDGLPVDDEALAEEVGISLGAVSQTKRVLTCVRINQNPKINPAKETSRRGPKETTERATKGI